MQSQFISFLFKNTSTTEIYTLSLHDALPISHARRAPPPRHRACHLVGQGWRGKVHRDRKSTRLNSSHPSISYAVFCLKKKTNTISPLIITDYINFFLLSNIIRYHTTD